MMNVVKVKDIVADKKFAVVDGPFGTQLHADEYVESGVPVVRVKNIGWGPFKDYDLKFITEEKAIQIERSTVYPGDIVLAKTGATIGKTCIFPETFEKAIIASSCAKISLNLEKAIPGYVYRFLLSPYGYAQIIGQSAGSTRTTIGLKGINDLKIPLPPLELQKKIAAILDAADEYRQKTKALIEKYDELLNSIVYQCLGDSLNKDLKNIKSGSKEFLEDGYSWYSLNEITELIADIDHKMPKSVEEGKIFLSAKDLSDNGELDFSNPKFISEEDFKHLSRKVKPKKLDIIYSRIGAKLGKARLVKTDHDFIVSYSCCTIRPKQDIVAPLYLKYILDSEATLRQASHGTKGIGVPDLGMGEIRTFKIPVPEKSISKKIVNQLERIEAQKAQAQASLAQAEDLFNSLLQRAFKGELV